MPTTTAPAVSLDDLIATKADLERLATKEDLAGAAESFRADLGSAVNLIMGELGKINARLEEHGGLLASVVATQQTHGTILARLVAKADGVE